MKTEQADTLVSTSEAAEILGVSLKTLRDWENNGKILAVRTEGNHRRFKKQDLNDFLESKKRWNKFEKTYECDMEKGIFPDMADLGICEVKLTKINGVSVLEIAQTQTEDPQKEIPVLCLQFKPEINDFEKSIERMVKHAEDVEKAKQERKPITSWRI